MAWVEFDYLANMRGLPSVACCYAVYFDEELVYVGSTNDLRNRFSGHAFRHGYGKNIHTPWGEFPNTLKFNIKYKPSVKYGDWLMREARLIRRLQPRFNKKLKGRKVALLSA
jgi:excinuclease UvrABC nuclease subunit